MEVTNQKQVALSNALLMYMVGVVLLITLIPFQFQIPQRISSIGAVGHRQGDCGLRPQLNHAFSMSDKRNSTPVPSPGATGQAG